MRGFIGRFFSWIAQGKIHLGPSWTVAIEPSRNLFKLNYFGQKNLFRSILWVGFFLGRIINCQRNFGKNSGRNYSYENKIFS